MPCGQCVASLRKTRLKRKSTYEVKVTDEVVQAKSKCNKRLINATVVCLRENEWKQVYGFSLHGSLKSRIDV